MTLRLKGSNSGDVSLKAPATAGDNTITLPTSNGSAEQFLKNSGTAGELEFSSMVETSTGIGIGTSAPSSLIHGEVSSGAATLTLKSTATSGEASVSLTGENSSGTARTGIFKYDNTDKFRIGTSSSVDIEFETNDTKRLRIAADGAILFENSAYAYFVSTASNQTSLTLKKGNSSADAADFFQCRTDNNTEKFTIKGTGNAENANGSYGSISDVKLKENIVDASSQWDDIKAVRVRNYNFKEDTGLETHTQIGVIAQELETVSPGLVSESTDRDEEGNDLGTVTKSVKQSILYMKAVKALQEAQTRIETLETQYTNLLARVTALEAAE